LADAQEELVSGRWSRVVVAGRGEASAGFTISATPAVIGDGGDVTVAWSGVAAPNASDIVTVACGPPGSVSASDYLAAVAAFPAGTPPATSGSVLLQSLPWLRCNYTASYVNMVGNSSVLVGSVAVSMRESLGKPGQGHLMMTADPAVLLITFTSGSNSTAPSVRIGTAPGTFGTIFVGSSQTYAASDMCQQPANQTSQLYFRDPGE
jgi:hypothetical protein